MIDTVKILIIRIIIFLREGGWHLLEATVFGNSYKNFKLFKFSSDDRHIDIGNGSIY